MAETKRPTSPAAEEILGLYFPVLDHGFVSLVDYLGTDECIERAARVSYGYGTRKQSLTRGLLRYLRRRLAQFNPRKRSRRNVAPNALAASQRRLVWRVDVISADASRSNR